MAAADAAKLAVRPYVALPRAFRARYPWTARLAVWVLPALLAALTAAVRRRRARDAAEALLAHAVKSRVASWIENASIKAREAGVSEATIAKAQEVAQKRRADDFSSAVSRCHTVEHVMVARQKVVADGLNSEEAERLCAAATVRIAEAALAQAIADADAASAAFEERLEQEFAAGAGPVAPEVQLAGEGGTDAEAPIGALTRAAQQLDEAVVDAAHGNVSGEWLRDARRVVRRLHQEAEMERTMLGQDTSALANACELAEEAGSSEHLIQLGKTRLVQLVKAKNRAAELDRVCSTGCSTKRITKAFRKAEAVGVATSELSEAKVQLRRQRAKERLGKAMRSGQTDIIDRAWRHADLAGVEGELIRRAEAIATGKYSWQ